MNSSTKIVVFGGSGYLGTALIDHLINKLYYSNILAVARNEGQLVQLKEKFPMVNIMVGDIADPWIVKQAMKDASYVYHLAAMKHVGLAEEQVRTCVNSNIIGTMNILAESYIQRPIFVVFISSDKAAQGTGVYGASKKIGEKLFAEASTINPESMYRVIRYGNVWASTGSIATKWKPKMQAGEEVILTDPEASRFFWTVEDAVENIFDCMVKSTKAVPYIPSMKAASMDVVLEACMQVYGRSPVKYIGLQPGENKYETMDGKVFSNQVDQFTVEEFKAKFLLNGKS